MWKENPKAIQDFAGLVANDYGSGIAMCLGPAWHADQSCVAVPFIMRYTVPIDGFEWSFAADQSIARLIEPTLVVLLVAIMVEELEDVFLSRE